MIQKRLHRFFVACLILIGSDVLGEESKFVILIASYNNVRYVNENIRSALDQEYHHFRILYIDDASTDGTDRILEEIQRKSSKAHLLKVIRNSTRQGTALANHYYAIHKEIADDEIVVILDGDDRLSDNQVLKYLDDVYSSKEKDIWLTYGQFRETPCMYLGFCCEYPEEIVQHHAFRKYVHMPSHLKTFYPWLFKKIRKEDLFYHGDFFRMAGDLAMMLPMIEMAAKHYAFISKVLYDYNEDNTLSDHRENHCFQMEMAMYIRNLTPYTPLD
jgi:glycosyltransferase involved in cell wall biosynthesis